jgi:hypothetical protein
MIFLSTIEKKNREPKFRINLMLKDEIRKNNPISFYFF